MDVDYIIIVVISVLTLFIYLLTIVSVELTLPLPIEDLELSSKQVVQWNPMNFNMVVKTYNNLQSNSFYKDECYSYMLTTNEEDVKDVPNIILYTTNLHFPYLSNIHFYVYILTLDNALHYVSKPNSLILTTTNVYKLYKKSCEKSKYIVFHKNE